MIFRIWLKNNKGFHRWNQIWKRGTWQMPKRIRIIIMAAATVIQRIRITVILQWDQMLPCQGNSPQTQPLAYQFEMIIIIILMVSSSSIFSSFSKKNVISCMFQVSTNCLLINYYLHSIIKLATIFVNGLLKRLQQIITQTFDVYLQLFVYIVTFDK